MRGTLVAMALGVTALAGCAPGNPGWVAADGSAGRADADYAACRRWADDRLDPDRSAETRGAGSPFAAEDRAALRRQINALVAACMQDRGYRLAPKRK